MSRTDFDANMSKKIRHLFDTPSEREVKSMHTLRYIYWKEEGWWLGYLQDYPDYWTQGETLVDLKDHLRDLYMDLSRG